MSDAQTVLRDAWLGGQEDRLCAREQAKAWALREVWREEKKEKAGNDKKQDSKRSEYGMLTFVADRVRKTTSKGMPTGDHPASESMKEFFTKIDEDSEWHPGKHCGGKRGPERILKGGKKNGVIQAAKKIKRDGGEVTYPGVIARCENAAINPDTGEPVDKALVYRVLREDIADSDDSDDHWDHRPRLSRQALDPPQIEKRYAWAKWMSEVLKHTSLWYFTNLVWCDLCNSILPRTMRKEAEQALARNSNMFWGSKAEQKHSPNLRGSKKALKMKSSDTVRVWFVPILVRGKFHIEALPDKFPGETEDGAAIMVSKVRAALNIRFQNSIAPKVVFTDRGNGFFQSGSGKITPGYRDALRQHGLKAFMGSDASMQPGTLQELMLHETAMAWVRQRLARTLPKIPWQETIPEYISRLKQVACYINDQYDVDGLNRELPMRVEKLLASDGDRINK